VHISICFFFPDIQQDDQQADHDTPSSTASGGTLRAAISPRVVGNTGTLVAGLHLQPQQATTPLTPNAAISASHLISPIQPVRQIPPADSPLSPRRRQGSVSSADGDATLVIKSPMGTLTSTYSSNAHPALLRITSTTSSTPSVVASPANHTQNTSTSSEHSSLGEPLHFGSLRTEL
jgi:hypothetical protein